MAAIIDMATRMIVGWSMANHMRTDLVEEALGLGGAQCVTAAGSAAQAVGARQRAVERDYPLHEHGRSRVVVFLEERVVGTVFQELVRDAALVPPSILRSLLLARRRGWGVAPSR